MFECHEKYIDIQIVLEGCERFEDAHGALKIEKSYSPERDIDFVSGRTGIRSILYPGQFAL